MVDLPVRALQCPGQFNFTPVSLSARLGQGSQGHVLLLNRNEGKLGHAIPKPRTDIHLHDNLTCTGL